MFRALVTGALALILVSGCQPMDDVQSQSPEGRLAGTVWHRERIALPEDARVEVRLEDVSIADVPATVLAEQTIETRGAQVPIPFELQYDSARIDASGTYGVRASIRAADGTLLFTSTEHHGVFEGGAPSDGVEILLVRNAGSGSADSDTGNETDEGAQLLGGAPWRLIAIRRPGGTEETVPAEPAYTMEFGADGRYSGQVHCNRHTGGYVLPGDGRLELTAGGATLAACPEPSLADEFLRALGAVERYERRADELLLTYETTGLLTFARNVESIAEAFPETGRTLVFDCAPGVSFTLRTGPGEIAIWSPESVGGRYAVLGATSFENGTRYEDGDDVVVLNDDRATFQVAGQRFEDCEPNQRAVPWADAARRGVTFRAIGNEPSWHLEISSMTLTMTTNLGADRVELAYEEPLVESLRTTYRAAADGHELVAVIDQRPCVDAMSGDPFEVTATVTFDGETFRGCGRFL